MSKNYNMSYAKEDIAEVLQQIHQGVRNNKYIIAKNENRQENLDFIREYNLTHSKQQDILLKIEVEDFCHSLQNTNVGYEHETLYVFCPQVELFSFDGEQRRVDIYTKFNIIATADGNRVIVISFHERNKPIDYSFR